MMTSPLPARLAPSETSASLWIPTLGIAAVMSTLYLAVVVLGLDPLPFTDLATAGLVATIFCLLCLVALVLVLRLPVFSFPFVFAFGAFLMSLAAAVLYGIEGDEAFNAFKVVYYDAFAQGLPVVMLAFSAFTLGSTLASGLGRNATRAPSPALTEKVAATHNTALALYWFFFVVMMLFSLRGPGFFTAISSGYTGGAGFADLRKAGQMSPVITITLAWFLPWLSMILLATSRSERQFARSTLIAALTCSIALLTGDRAVTVMMIALLLQIRHLLGYVVRWRRVVLLGALASAIIVTWPTIRTIPVREWSPSVISEALTVRFTEQATGPAEHPTAVGRLVGGMAPSYQPVMVACYYVPEVEPYRWGFDYFRSAATSLPFVARAFPEFLRHDLAPALWMMNRIDPNFWTGRGFNQIAEAYLQGGAVGVIGLYLLLGLYLVWIWNRMRGEPDLRRLAFHVLVVAALYKWIRNDSGGVGRNIVWAGILVYLLPAIFQWIHHRLSGRSAATVEVMAEAPVAAPRSIDTSSETPFPGVSSS